MAFLGKIKEIGKNIVYYFTHVDGVKIVDWVRYVFVLAVTIIMTRASNHLYYNMSGVTKLNYAEYVAANRSLMVSFSVCAIITWVFLSALIAWAVGKLVKTKFNIK